MSQFYSDLINWTGGVCLGTAVILAGLPDAKPPAEGESTPVAAEPILIASASEADAVLVSQALHDAATRAKPDVADSADAGEDPLLEVIAAATVTPVVSDGADTRQTTDAVRQADLTTVLFTSVGVEANPAHASQPDAPELMGRVTGSSVNIRSGPGTSNPVVGRGVRDQEFRVTGESDGAWVQIVMPLTGERAWIHTNYFLTPERIAAN